MLSHLFIAQHLNQKVIQSLATGSGKRKYITASFQCIVDLWNLLPDNGTLVTSIDGFKLMEYVDQIAAHCHRCMLPQKQHASGYQLQNSMGWRRLLCSCPAWGHVRDNWVPVHCRNQTAGLEGPLV